METMRTPVIEVGNLHKEYRNTVAVDDISFTVERGEIFGILGPNGAGKTTTVECVEGVRKPDRGNVRVLGLDPQHDRAELHQRVGVQLQEAQLYRLAVIDAGRVVATDTPAGLVSRVTAEQRLRFRPSAPLDDALLAALPEVTGVARHGGQVVVTGTEKLTLEAER